MENVKSSKGFILLLSVFISICSYGQSDIKRGVKVLSDSSLLVYKTPTYCLSVVNDKDTVFIGIFADSLSSSILEAHILVLYPLNFNLSSPLLSILFEDDSIDTLRPYSIKYESMYVDYSFERPTIIKMLKLNVKSICLKGDGEHHYLEGNSNYFRYFLNHYFD